MTEEESRIDYLIANGMDVNEKYLDHPHLINMCIEGNIEYVEKIIKNGADVNYETKLGWTPLIYAIDRNYVKLAELLIKNGADVNCETKNSQTALMHMIDRNYVKLAELLIKNGADVNYETKNGWTPLMFAIFSQKANFVELLIKNGADINYANKKNEIEGIFTPLLIAIRFNAKLVELLIRNGVNVNYETKDGWTPLMYAMSTEDAKLVELLIKNGADVNYVTKDGTTPLDYALKTRKLQIVPLLLKYTNGNKNSLSKKSVSSQTNTASIFLQTQGTFSTALVSLSKIIARYGTTLFLVKNRQKLIGLLSDLFPRNNEFYPKFKEAFSSDFAELLFLANEKSEDEKIVALKMASDEIMRNTGLQNADAAAISKLVALSLDWDLEM